MMTLKVWLHVIISALSVISDRDYQDRIWVRALDKNIQDSYIETMSNLFDEGDIRNFLKNYAIKAELTPLQIESLKKTVDAIDSYDGSKLTHEQLLKDPQWIKITDMAKETLKILPKDSLDVKKD